jgi:hypothetical protein
MSDTSVKKFMVFFSIPLATMAEWQKTDPQVRAAAEATMMQDWVKWSEAHAKMILSTEVGGKTKNVVRDAVSDTRNDIVLYSLVQGESHDAVAAAYQSHPHLQIPNASIQVMEVKPMGPM